MKCIVISSSVDIYSVFIDLFPSFSQLGPEINHKSLTSFAIKKKMIQFEDSAEYTFPPSLLKRLPVHPKTHCKNELIKKLLYISFSKLTVV